MDNDKSDDDKWAEVGSDDSKNDPSDVDGSYDVRNITGGYNNEFGFDSDDDFNKDNYSHGDDNGYNSYNDDY